VSDFDFESVFGDDYLHFYETVLTDEVSDRQVATIAGFVTVQPGVRVLDCPCGFGRISNRLAGLGADVVAIDSGERFLEVARKAGSPVDYRLADMRELDFDAEFDVIVNVFTSFGYYDERTDRAVLAGFRRALKPGGRLVIDLLNSQRIFGYIAAGGGVSLSMLQRDDDLLIDRNGYDAAEGRLVTERISVRDGKVRRYHFSVRAFSPFEISSWLRDAGFTSVDVFDQDGQPFTLAARRMWAVATA
jgi:SAM-dependent methyltransferase